MNKQKNDNDTFDGGQKRIRPFFTKIKQPNQHIQIQSKTRGCEFENEMDELKNQSWSKPANSKEWCVKVDIILEQLIMIRKLNESVENLIKELKKYLKENIK